MEHKKAYNLYLSRVIVLLHIILKDTYLFIMTNNTFKSGDTYWKQLTGAAMGHPPVHHTPQSSMASTSLRLLQTPQMYSDTSDILMPSSASGCQTKNPLLMSNNNEYIPWVRVGF